jgi:hypothetical protein
MRLAECDGLSKGAARAFDTSNSDVSLRQRMPPLSRRHFLALSGAPWLARPCLAAESADIAERAHAEVWRRFIDRRFDVLLHYAGLHGEVILPGAADCREARPNGMGWSSPIEDGPFFGGLYLDGLCNRWRARRDEESAEKARRIAAGLMRLAGFSNTPGFVPRGIGADGESFYPASSEDQVFPWFYGLWRYLATGLSSREEQAEIEAKLVETGRAVASHDWRVPCVTTEYGFRGSFLRPSAHDAARLFFLLRVMAKLTGEERWMEEYRSRFDEAIGKPSRPRGEILSEGLEFDAQPGGKSRVWTHSMSQAALRELPEVEEDAAIRELFRSALLASARRAVPYLEHAKGYARDNDLLFEIDWRFLNASWRPQANCDEAIALGREQLPMWAERNPRSPWEDETMREPLFAAWMIRLANDPGLNRDHETAIQGLLERYDWSGLYTASGFIAVNLAYEGSRDADR